MTDKQISDRNRYLRTKHLRLAKRYQDKAFAKCAVGAFGPFALTEKQQGYYEKASEGVALFVKSPKLKIVKKSEPVDSEQSQSEPVESEPVDSEQSPEQLQSEPVESEPLDSEQSPEQLQSEPVESQPVESEQSPEQSQSEPVESEPVDSEQSPKQSHSEPVESEQSESGYINDKDKLPKPILVILVAARVLVSGGIMWLLTILQVEYYVKHDVTQYPYFLAICCEISFFLLGMTASRSKRETIMKYSILFVFSAYIGGSFGFDIFEGNRDKFKENGHGIIKLSPDLENLISTTIKTNNNALKKQTSGGDWDGISSTTKANADLISKITPTKSGDTLGVTDSLMLIIASIISFLPRIALPLFNAYNAFCLRRELCSL